MVSCAYNPIPAKKKKNDNMVCFLDMDLHFLRSKYRKKVGICFLFPLKILFLHGFFGFYSPNIMNSIFQEQIDKTRMMITGVRRNIALVSSKAGVGERDMNKLEDEVKRLERAANELDKLQYEVRRKTIETREAYMKLRNHTIDSKRSIKKSFDHTWWKRFGIEDKR